MRPRSKAVKLPCEASRDLIYERNTILGNNGEKLTRFRHFRRDFFVPAKIGKSPFCPYGLGHLSLAQLRNIAGVLWKTGIETARDSDNSASQARHERVKGSMSMTLQIPLFGCLSDLGSTRSRTGWVINPCLNRSSSEPADRPASSRI